MSELPNDLRAYLGSLPPEKVSTLKRNDAVDAFSEWVLGLRKWGRPVLVRAAYALSADSIRLWPDLSEKDSVWNDLIRAVEVPELMDLVTAYLANPATFQAVHYDSLIERNTLRIKRAELYETDGVDYGDFVSTQSKSLQVAKAVFFTAQSAHWSSAKVGEGESDSSEYQARLENGPVYEVVRAIWYSRQARHVEIESAIVTIKSAIDPGVSEHAQSP